MRLVHAVGGIDCIIFFTRKSQNDRFYDEFVASGCKIIDVSKFTDNKAIYFVNMIYRGIISFYINRQKLKPIIFNGQCNFGYKISRWIKRDISQLEFIHTFCSFSFIRMPFLEFYKKTISSSKKTIQDHKKYYETTNTPYFFKERFLYILYGIQLPEKKYKLQGQQLIVLFVGRGTAEKRVHLIAYMAKTISEEYKNIQFEFMGDVENSIPADLKKYCYLYGNQTDPSIIEAIYSKADILIITSLFEGFPLVVMEGMARGLIVISTSVGDIPVHIKQGVNGYLIDEIEDEEIIIQKGIHYIKFLKAEREIAREISKNNIEYAFQNFGLDSFNSNYQKLFASLK